MKKFRGFLLKHRVTSLFRWRHRPPPGYHRLNPTPRSVSCIFNRGARIKAKARAICYKSVFRSGYLRFREDEIVEGCSTASYGAVPKGKMAVPKGKMAVYVGQNDGGYERVLMPLIYIYHPLFGQLLTKAEEEYGHHHPGGITIPCRISEFENVKTRIAAGCAGRKVLRWAGGGRI